MISACSVTSWVNAWVIISSSYSCRWSSCSRNSFSWRNWATSVPKSWNTKKVEDYFKIYYLKETCYSISPTWIRINSTILYHLCPCSTKTTSSTPENYHQRQILCSTLSFQCNFGHCFSSFSNDFNSSSSCLLFWSTSRNSTLNISNSASKVSLESILSLTSMVRSVNVKGLGW